LPMLALVKARDLFAIGLPIALFMAATDGYGRWIISAFAVRAALLVVQMLVLTPVLRVRQGAWSYWLIAPFVVIYGPLVLAARCAGAWVGVRHILELRRGRVAVARAGVGAGHRNPDVRRGRHVGHEERALRWGTRAVALAGVMLAYGALRRVQSHGAAPEPRSVSAARATRRTGRRARPFGTVLTRTSATLGFSRWAALSIHKRLITPNRHDVAKPTRPSGAPTSTGVISSRLADGHAPAAR
jgi:hypothetical protein